ncbi:TPA: DUF551 domain-containing protein [Escherichia coli]|nr:DUF551 domain-containing protein [Escherichia coli]
MSNITKELAKLFRKITNSEIDAEGNAHVVLSPADSLLINNARIALASLEAEPVCVIDQSNLDYLKSGSDADVWPASRAEMGDVLLYRSATPAPVSVPAAMEMDDDFDSAFEHGKAVGWNAYRAAMLQAEPVSNSDELPLDYLQGHKDGLEWAAQLAEANHPQTGDWLYDDQIELARAIRKGPDMPTVQGGSSPVTPDSWISCSERMPNDKQYVWCWGKSYGWTECDTFEGYYDWSRNKWWAVTDDGEEPASKVTHWMPLPEPPQEVNRG